MKLQICLVGVIMLSITSFTNPETNVTVTKKSLPERSVHKVTPVAAHLYNVVDDNSHTINKLLFILDGTTIQAIGLYDGTGGTCNDYTNESWTGTVTYHGGYTAHSIYITYSYPGGGSGSVTIDGPLDPGGIICD